MSYTEPLATLSLLALSAMGAGFSANHLGHLLAIWPLGSRCEMAKWPRCGHAIRSESLAVAGKGQKDTMATTNSIRTYGRC
jgi:hypothetical protein